MTNNLQDIASRIYNGIAAGDPRSFVEALAEDVVVELHGAAPYAGRLVGKAALLETLGKTRQLKTGEKQTFEKILTSADTVVVVGYEEFTVVATGKRTKGPFVHHLTFRDGRIASFEDFEVAGADAWA